MPSASATTETADRDQHCPTPSTPSPPHKEAHSDTAGQMGATKIGDRKPDPTYRTPTPPTARWILWRDPNTNNREWYGKSPDGSEASTPAQWFFVEDPGDWTKLQDHYGILWRNCRTSEEFYEGTGSARPPHGKPILYQ